MLIPILHTDENVNLSPHHEIINISMHFQRLHFELKTETEHTTTTEYSTYPQRKHL